MANVIDYPGMPTGEPEAQCQQLWTYLYLLAERLNQTLTHITIDNMGDAERAALMSISSAVSMRAETSVRTEKAAATISAQLAQSESNMRSLVSKTQRDLAATTAAAKAELSQKLTEAIQQINDASERIDASEGRIVVLAQGQDETVEEINGIMKQIEEIGRSIEMMDRLIKDAYRKLGEIEERVTELEEDGNGK